MIKTKLIHDKATHTIDVYNIEPLHSNNEEKRVLIMEKFANKRKVNKMQTILLELIPL